MRWGLYKYVQLSKSNPFSDSLQEHHLLRSSSLVIVKKLRPRPVLRDIPSGWFSRLSGLVGVGRSVLRPSSTPVPPPRPSVRRPRGNGDIPVIAAIHEISPHFGQNGTKLFPTLFAGRSLCVVIPQLFGNKSRSSNAPSDDRRLWRPPNVGLSSHQTLLESHEFCLGWAMRRTSI